MKLSSRGNQKMLRNLVLVFLLMPVFNGCLKEEKDDDWGEDNLNGRVCTVTQLTYAAEERFGKIRKLARETDWSRRDNFQKTYDENGNLIELKKLISDGSVESMLTKTYDKHENIIESSSFDEKGGLLEKQVYSYDHDQLIVESCTYNSEGRITERQVFSYNEDGNMIESIIYGVDGTVFGKTIYQYDEDRNVPNRLNSWTSFGA